MYRRNMADEGFAGLLEPECLMPSQHHDMTAPAEIDRPEIRLLLAVIDDAIATIHHGALDRSYRESPDFAEAAGWVASTDLTWPFSFENVCGALGWDPGQLRRRLEGWTEGRAPGRVGNWRSRHRRQNGSRHAINLPRHRSRARTIERAAS